MSEIMKGNLIFSNLIIIRISTLRRRKKHLCTYIRAAERSNVRFKMQKEAVPDGNCRRDWPEPRFAGDQTARTTRFLLFSSVIPSFLPLYLSLFLYIYILLIAWLITSRCLDLGYQNCVHLLTNLLPSPLPSRENI